MGWCDDENPNYDLLVHLCNDKLIGAWDYTDDGNKGEDNNGHGSHTASTAGGNVIDAAVDAPTISLERTISGVAPHANLLPTMSASAQVAFIPLYLPLSTRQS